MAEQREESQWNENVVDDDHRVAYARVAACDGPRGSGLRAKEADIMGAVRPALGRTHAFCVGL